MLPTFFKQVMCSVNSEAVLFYSLPGHERLDQQVHSQWQINSLSMGHMMHHDGIIYIEPCHSPPVDYGTRLLITRRKHYSQTIVMRQYMPCQIQANSMTLTHWYQWSQILLPRMWWQLTCASLRCLWAIWSRTDGLVSCEGIGVLLTAWCSFCKDLLFHMKATYLPVHLHMYSHSIFPVLMSSLTKHIPRNVEILEKLLESHHPMCNFYISEHVWRDNVNASKWHLENDLTEVQI